MGISTKWNTKCTAYSSTCMYLPNFFTLSDKINFSAASCCFKFRVFLLLEWFLYHLKLNGDADVFAFLKHISTKWKAKHLVNNLILPCVQLWCCAPLLVKYMLWVVGKVWTLLFPEEIPHGIMASVGLWLLMVWFLCFNGISTFVGYLMPKPFSKNNSSGTI